MLMSRNYVHATAVSLPVLCCCPSTDNSKSSSAMAAMQAGRCSGAMVMQSRRSLPLAPSSRSTAVAGTPVRPLQHHQQQRVLAQPALLRARSSTVAVQARYRGGSPGVGERVLAAIPYLLPFLDSFSYGRFLFYQYPIITRAIAPLAPLISFYATVPFAPLLAFFGVYLGIVNNMQWPRFVRFNAMQAMLLDILLILPRLAEQVLSTPTGGWALQAYITASNTIWIFVAAAVLYGIGASLTGQAARIPLVADAAEQQVR